VYEGNVADFLSDEEVKALLAEEKRLPAGYSHRFVLKEKRGHGEFELDLDGTDGSAFRVVARRSNFNLLDFSVILAYCAPGSNQVLRLRRYNGKSHEHTNPIERQTFYDFHIHTTTERYQRSGNREDTFAEVTDRYANVDQAVECLFEDCGFIVPDELQPSLFRPRGGG
jgi:hypothetical protein